MSNTKQGFIYLTTDKVRDNLVEILTRVMFDNERIILQQGDIDVAAMISLREFERLDYLWDKLHPSPFNPEDEEYYLDEKGIHCVYLDEIESAFADIIDDVRFEGEFFGLLPPENLGNQEVDCFAPGAILMNLERFWISDELLDSNLTKEWQQLQLASQFLPNVNFS